MNYWWFLLFLLGFSLLAVFLINLACFALERLLETSWFFPDKQRLLPKNPNQKQLEFEFRQQIKSIFLSTFIGYGAVFLVLFENKSQIYHSLNQYSLFWFFLTIPVMILASDLYIYTIHRTLHSRPFFKKIHNVHHKSLQVNIFSSYSLDVLESVAYTLFLALFITFVPTHWLNFLLFMGLTVIYNFYVHSGWEILPVKNPLFKYLNTASLHHVHHSQHHYNFGFYTNLFDRLFGTFKQD